MSSVLLLKTLLNRHLFCQLYSKRSIPKGMLFRFGGTTLSLEPTAKRQFILSEQEKTPCYGVFSTRYPTKQGVSEVKLVFARETTMRLGRRCLQKILHASAGFLLFTSYFFTLTSNGRIFWEVIGKR